MKVIDKKDWFQRELFEAKFNISPDYTSPDSDGQTLWQWIKANQLESQVDVNFAGEYVGQKYLPIAETIGDLKKQIEDLPDEMPFGFLNQPMQQIAIREWSGGGKCAVFNGVESKISD